MLIGIVSAGVWLGVVSGWHVAVDKLVKYFPINDSGENNEIDDEINRAVDDLLRASRKN